MIRFEDVKKSYSGKPGCACGCNGKYQVAAHYGVERANAETGYEAYDKPSDRSVKSTLSKINRLIDWTDPKAVSEAVFDDFAFIDNEDGTRTYTVYFVTPGFGKQVRLEAAGKAMLALVAAHNEAWNIVEKEAE